MVFGDGGKQNESMVFQCFPRLTPVAPVPSDVLKSSFFFQQYHYCKLHSRSCCKCRSCQVDEVVKIGSFNTLNEGVPFPVPAPVTGEGDGGKFSKHFNGFWGRGGLFQRVQWFFGDGEKQIESMVFQCFPRLTPVAPVSFFLAFFKQNYTLIP